MDAYGVIYYLLDAVMIFHGAYFKRGVKRTFEEIYSNWRNKVEEAAKNHYIFASYMNMCSLQFMFSELSSEFEIGGYDIMEEYNPDCLEENVRMYDKYLEKYEAAYKKAGIEVNRFSDVDAFVAVYLGK
jgi:hypothetical protein